MLKKVISGGQTGVDIAALRAARAVGLETGGHVPSGCRTLNGPNHDLVIVFGCAEHTSPSYPPRTRANVANSDATLRLAASFNSPGERCTERAIDDLKRPSLDLHYFSDYKLFGFTPDEVSRWIMNSNITVLNVAGNSERTCPGIEEAAEAFLTTTFKLCINGR